MNFKGIYLVITFCLLVMGIEHSEPIGRIFLLTIFAANIPLHYESLKKWWNEQ